MTSRPRKLAVHERASAHCSGGSAVSVLLQVVMKKFSQAAMKDEELLHSIKAETLSNGMACGAA